MKSLAFAKNKRFISLCCALMLVFGLVAAPISVYAAGGLVASGSVEGFIPQGKITVTIPAGKTAKTLQVLINRNGGIQSGVTGRITGPGISGYKDFAANGQFQNIPISSISGSQTATYTITIAVGSYEYKYNAAIMLLD